MSSLDRLKKKRERERKEYERNQTLPSKLLPKVNWQEVPNALEKLKKNHIENSWNTFDLPYRIYHNSFKMFQMTDKTVEVWQILFDLLNLKPFPDRDLWLENNYPHIDNVSTKEDQAKRIKAYEEYNKKRINHLLKNLKKIGADRRVLDQMKLLRPMSFDLTKNDPKVFNWSKGGVILVGCYELSKKIVDSTLDTLNAWKNKEGHLWEDKMILNEKEALAMETLSFVSLRYMDFKTKKEEIANLKEKLTKILS